jgi:hypothetical protein
MPLPVLHLSCPADAVGIDPSAAAAATPKPTAETIDSNKLSDVEEGKDIPDVFVRKETVSGACRACGQGGRF